MKVKKIFLVAVCFVLMFSLVGCGNKTVKNTSDFKAVVEGHNYTVSDITAQYASYGYIKEATVAASIDGWQVEFYVLDDSGRASSMFNTNRITFEGYKRNVSTELSSNIGNYETYTLTSDGYYMHLCRVDNTLLYVRVLDTYKNEVKDLIDELGY